VADCGCRGAAMGRVQEPSGEPRTA
jgi:hypothetical protein